MKQIDKMLDKVDDYQRKHIVPGFIYSIIKKNSQDNGGYLTAVITYYSFLSLFPMLIVLTSLTKLILGNNSYLKNKIVGSAAHYFPIIGSQLQYSIHSPKQTGIALIVSLIITFYGARGVANVLQYSLSSIWYVPHYKNPSFINNLVRSFSIMIFGGIGLLISSVVSGYTAIPGNAVFDRLLTLVASFLLLWLTFTFVFKFSIAGTVKIKQILVSALLTALGLQIFQTLGTLIMVHELKGLNSIYGTFALVVGLLFWIYLQTKVLLYAVGVDVIRYYHLYQRSLRGKQTVADKAAYKHQNMTYQKRVEEKIDPKF